ncbi:hypothetical protein LU604_17530 [Erwinia tracheiphila]|uniref:Uncharacterized protein n=1 Tax=Erwinia tracheiphila TaxID=65700 RepID=A0A345CNU3_9GAMM|nr:hypothetical protein [Erwinia tracheiphila]AXF75110.1 hypothetical protein AV903_01650 [Erwinia tracheiphila]UIA82343.1 hypothetical protein LU604_17530 [Erwinia tracheiphila]UIA90939.1 hypothetical protein LU632_17110 [Erwinia tracheiphila]
MADNNFGFELRADDRASAVLQQINDQVKVLQPELAKAREGLTLGGQETEEGLTSFNTQFQNLSRLAKDNVQLFGDMVPPLKIVSGLTGDFAAKVTRFGAMGALTYGAVKGISAVGSAMSDAAEDAYSLDVAAKNAGMSVHDFSQLSGAVRLLGADSASAQSSVEGLYKTFNDALQGRNSNVLAVMAQLNAPIARNADGTANVLKTMEGLAAIFPKLAPQNQKTVADALGLDANGLRLLREGARLKDLLTKSDQIGLTVDPEANSALASLNSQLVELSATWDGFKKRSQQKIAGALLSDGSVKDGLEGVGDLMTNGDFTGLSHALGFISSADAAKLRKMQENKALYDSLTRRERGAVDAGFMTDAVKKRYDSWYGATDQAAQLQSDLLAVNPAPAAPPFGTERPSSVNVNPRARSVRNNNPWNLRYAGQRNAMPAGGNFAAFSTPEEGLLAADRQLQLYASGKSRAAKGVPLTTLRSIINVASPSNENDTTQMIRDASRELQTSPDSQLNLDDPGERSRVLHALFEREGNNPWSTAQIQQLITNTGAQPGTQTANQTAPQPLSGNGSGPSPVIPLITPPQPASPVQTQELTETLATALKDNGIKVELTLINDKTGDRKTFTGSGGKIATAMTFP